LSGGTEKGTLIAEVEEPELQSFLDDSPEINSESELESTMTAGMGDLVNGGVDSRGINSVESSLWQLIFTASSIGANCDSSLSTSSVISSSSSSKP